MSIKGTFLVFVPLLYVKAQCGDHEIFTRADALLKVRQYEEAARVLDGQKHCNTLSPIDRFQMGWLYGRARHFATALEMFNGVPEDVPDLQTHKYAVALSKFELEDYRGATTILKSLRSQSAFDVNSANLLAVSYSKLGLYQEAYSVLVQDLRDHPQDLPGYLNMATVCAEGGDFAKAAETASTASRLFPQSAEVLVVRGAANTMLGHLDQAREDFKAAVSIAPLSAEPLFFLALTHYKLGNYADAAYILRSALKEGIADADLHYLLAECILKLDPVDTRKVLGQLTQAIEVNPNSVPARTLRGKLLLEAGHPKEAITDLQRACRLDATSRSAAYNLARAYRAEGRAVESETLFRRLRSETGDTLTELGDKRIDRALKQSSTGAP